MEKRICPLICEPAKAVEDIEIVLGAMTLVEIV